MHLHFVRFATGALETATWCHSFCIVKRGGEKLNRSCVSPSLVLSPCYYLGEGLRDALIVSQWPTSPDWAVCLDCCVPGGHNGVFVCARVSLTSISSLPGCSWAYNRDQDGVKKKKRKKILLLMFPSQSDKCKCLASVSVLVPPPPIKLPSTSFGISLSGESVVQNT